MCFTFAKLLNLPSCRPLNLTVGVHGRSRQYLQSIEYEENAKMPCPKESNTRSRAYDQYFFFVANSMFGMYCLVRLCDSMSKFQAS